MTPVRLLVVDDEDIVRESYAAFFARREGYEICGEAATGDQAVAAYEALRPDVVLMDLQMPGTNGVDATREISRRHPAACVVALTTFGTREYVVAALRAGAAGYVLKDAGGEALLAAVDQALSGEMPLSAGVRRELVSAVLSADATEAPRAAPAAPHPGVCEGGAGSPMLTDRERELLRWLAQGMTNHEIAAHMYVSEGSVKQYLAHIADKWCLKSRTQILIRAIQVGVVEPHDVVVTAR